MPDIWKRQLEQLQRKTLLLLGLEHGAQTPLDRKDALTRRPLDFDAEEETRKHETSKWLEHHFGSESRSSNSTLDDEEQPPKTSFFNVTIKSQPSRTDNLQRNFSSVNNSSARVYSPVEPERDRNQFGYYKGNRVYYAILRKASLKCWLLI